MKNNKARHGLWLVVGAYLAYTGIRLVRDVMSDRPNNFMLMVAAGVLFVGVGIAVAVRSVKELKKPTEDDEDDEDTEDIDEEDTIDESEDSDNAEHEN